MSFAAIKARVEALRSVFAKNMTIPQAYEAKMDRAELVGLVEQLADALRVTWDLLQLDATPMPQDLVELVSAALTKVRS